MMSPAAVAPGRRAVETSEGQGKALNEDTAAFIDWDTVLSLPVTVLQFFTAAKRWFKAILRWPTHCLTHLWRPSVPQSVEGGTGRKTVGTEW